MAEEIEWRPSSVAMWADGRLWPFVRPVDLLRFGPISLRSRIRMGAAVVRVQKRERDVGAVRGPHRARLGDRGDGPAGVGQGLGAAPARQVRRPRRRDLGGLAVGQAVAAPAGRGGGAQAGDARLPARIVRGALRGATRADRGARRRRVDRPARCSGSHAATTAASGSGRGARVVPPRPRPARVRAGRARARALRRGARDGPERRLRPDARRRPARRARRRLRRVARARSSTRRRSACCSSSTAASRPTTGRTSPIPRCRSSA